MNSKRVFVCADHGLAIFYFLKSDLVSTILDAGVEVILLTEDKTRGAVEERFGRPGLIIEDLRLAQLQTYQKQVSPSGQWWVDFFRRAGAADGTTVVQRTDSLGAVDTYIEQVQREAHARRKQIFPLVTLAYKSMRKSRLLRRVLMNYQDRYTPFVYKDLFDKYQPDLVIAASPGYRLDRYLLREAAARNVPSVAAIMSWDSSSSYGLPGAKINWITCWSQIQKNELMGGGDWPEQRVNVGGMPPYDGYIHKEWVIPRQEFFDRHSLDPGLKLLSYASSFVNLSPNIQNIEALLELVNLDRLDFPSQLLVRLHPNHMSGHFVAEAERIRELASQNPRLHVTEPATFGAIGHYSIEDLADRTSMIAHSDVFMTVYSTMVVEASFQERPIVSVCIDSENGYPGKYWIPFSKITHWPTHSRFRLSGAGRVATNKDELRQALNFYLSNPQADMEAQRRFLEQEVAFLDGTSGRHTGAYFLSLLDKIDGK